MGQSHSRETLLCPGCLRGRTSEWPLPWGRGHVCACVCRTGLWAGVCLLWALQLASALGVITALSH